MSRRRRFPQLLVWVWVPLSLLGLAVGVGWHWWVSPGPAETPRRVEVASGSGPATIARQLAAAGVLEHPSGFVLMVRLRGETGRLKAGEYEFAPRQSPAAVLAQLVAGRVTRYTVTFIEGHTVAEAWERLRAHPHIRATPGLDLRGLMRALGEPDVAAEGAFFPDTYVFRRGATDVSVMREARRRMRQELDAAWAGRHSGLPLRDADEALVLASLIEKETGAADERPMIAGVFVNRLRIGMRLQTDPSVIYGLGSRYDGNLRKADLRRDGPYNTYRRAGLPPTPIALPGRESLRAATQPAATGAVYFVATGLGDGRHVFSTTLKEHNAAVRRLVARTRESKDAKDP